MRHLPTSTAGKVESALDPADRDALGRMHAVRPVWRGVALAFEKGRLAVDAERRTSVPGIWAGGDCVAGGQDLTVAAVEDGKQAALSIDRALKAKIVTEAA